MTHCPTSCDDTPACIPTPCVTPCMYWLWWVIGLLALIALILGIIWLVMGTNANLSLSGARYVSVSDAVNKTDVTVRMTSSRGANETVSVKGGQLFTFSHQFRDGESYQVVIDGDVGTAFCSVLNGVGKFGLNNIDNIRVQCGLNDAFDPDFQCYKQHEATSTAALFFGFDDAAAHSVKLTIDNVEMTVLLSGSTGNYSVEHNFGGYGSFIVTAEMLNSLGDPISQTSNPFVIFMSTLTPPTTTTLTSTSANTFDIAGVFGTTAGSTVQFALDSDFCNLLAQQATTSTGGCYSLTLTGIGGGEHTVHVRGYETVSEPSGFALSGNVNVLI